MRGAMDRARSGSIARRMAALCLAIPLAGCASMTQDVDAYYRQMAVNYQEAIEQAKVDETHIERQAQVMATTGDKKKLEKYQRVLAKIRQSEDGLRPAAETFREGGRLDGVALPHQQGGGRQRGGHLQGFGVPAHRRSGWQPGP